MKRKIKIFDIVNDTILILIALICVYPFLYVFFTAVSDGAFLQRGEVNFLPKGFNLEAFKYIMGSSKFHVWSGLRNSFIYTIGGTAISIFLTYITAFALSRDRIKGRYFLMGAFIVTWVFDAGIIPQYIIYSKLGFVDNPWVMLVPGAINTQFLIITKTFIEGIPKELEEAALVDGANDWTVLTRIFFPLSKTIVATIGTFYAVSIWNQYLIPQIYLKSDSFKVIQQVLKDVVIADAGTSTAFKNVIINGVTLNQQNLKAAAIFIAMLPIVLVYPFVQKYFKKGIMMGAVKG